MRMRASIIINASQLCVLLFVVIIITLYILLHCIYYYDASLFCMMNVVFIQYFINSSSLLFIFILGHRE